MFILISYVWNYCQSLLYLNWQWKSLELGCITIDMWWIPIFFHYRGLVSLLTFTFTSYVLCVKLTISYVPWLIVYKFIHKLLWKGNGKKIIAIGTMYYLSNFLMLFAIREYWHSFHWTLALAFYRLWMKLQSIDIEVEINLTMEEIKLSMLSLSWVIRAMFPFSPCKFWNYMIKDIFMVSCRCLSWIRIF